MGFASPRLRTCEGCYHGAGLILTADGAIPCSFAFVRIYDVIKLRTSYHPASEPYSILAAIDIDMTGLFQFDGVVDVTLLWKAI